MNILHLTTHLNTGGIASYIATLAHGLTRKGHTVIIASSGGDLVLTLQAQGGAHFKIPIRTKQEVSPVVMISFWKLLPFMKRKEVDIIHAHTRVTQVLGCLLAGATRKPYISTCHGFFKKRFFRKIFPCWGNRVIAISESVKEHLMKDFAIPEERIRLIHSGIDGKKFKIQNSKFKNTVKQEYGLGEGPVAGIVARLSDVKGHKVLLNAMKQVLHAIPKAQLLIVGEGKMKAELISTSKLLGIERNVVFIPRVLDTARILSIMDVFIMPSLQEGLGLSLMEAMAAGLPVVGSDVGGIKTLIQDGYNGLLVKPGDNEHLARAIVELLYDTRKARLLGENAAGFIAQNFTQEKMIEETEEVYRECLEE